MTQCPSCAATIAPNQPRCPSCGASVEKTDEGEAGQFQSLGAVKLKRAKRTSDGRITEAEGGANPAPGTAGAQNDAEGMAGALQTDLLEQAGLMGQGGADFAELDVDSGATLIGAPPVIQDLPEPKVIRATEVADGLKGTVSYGLKGPRLAQQQRENLKHLGVDLAKLKKRQQELLAALGKAARLHDLTPPECQHLVDVSQDQEMSSLEQRLKAEEVTQAHHAADQAYQSRRAEGEAKLATLEKQHAGLVAKSEAIQSKLSATEQQIEQFRRREQELRAASAPGAAEAEAAQRVQEYEEIKAQRKIAEMEVESLGEQVQAAKRPIGRIREEISRVKEEIQAAQNRLTAAESQARVVEVSGQRREAMANRNLAEVDEEIGRAILDGAGRVPALRQMLVSSEACRRQVAFWESMMADQQAELDRFDEPRARKGFWILFVSVVGVLTLLAMGGEVLRRLMV